MTWQEYFDGLKIEHKQLEQKASHWRHWALAIAGILFASVIIFLIIIVNKHGYIPSPYIGVFLGLAIPAVIIFCGGMIVSGWYSSHAEVIDDDIFWGEIYMAPKINEQCDVDAPVQGITKTTNLLEVYETNLKLGLQSGDLTIKFLTDMIAFRKRDGVKTEVEERVLLWWQNNKN